MYKKNKNEGLKEREGFFSNKSTGMLDGWSSWLTPKHRKAEGGGWR